MTTIEGLALLLLTGAAALFLWYVASVYDERKRSFEEWDEFERLVNEMTEDKDAKSQGTDSA